MKRFLILLFALLLVAPAYAADRITATVTFTNVAANDNTFIVNGSTRTWKTTVTVPASQILVGASKEECTTNAVNHIIATPFNQIAIYQLGADSFRLDGQLGVYPGVTGAGSYYSVTYSTQTVATAYDVIVPYTSFPSVRRQTITEGIVDWLNLASGKAIFENSASVSNLVGRTNTQSMSGIKTWTGSNYFTTAVMTDPVATNLIAWETSQFENVDIIGTLGFDGNASYINADSDYFSLTPETSGYPVYLGQWGQANGISAYEGNFTNQVRIGTLYATNTTHFGPTQFANTNQFLANSDIAFTRYAVTSLANGNNAAVPVGTNVFVEVSGPSGSFNINGIYGSPNRDGKFLIVLNLTTHNMTVVHDSGVDPTAGNRIYTLTGSDVSTTGNGSATFIYNASVSRWILLDSSP